MDGVSQKLREQHQSEGLGGRGFYTVVLLVVLILNYL